MSNLEFMRLLCDPCLSVEEAQTEAEITSVGTTVPVTRIGSDGGNSLIGVRPRLRQWPELESGKHTDQGISQN